MHGWGVMRVFAILLIFLISAGAAAQECKDENAIHRTPEQNLQGCRYFLAAFAANPKNDTTLEKLYDKYQATVAFSCSGGRATGNIVKRGNLLVLNAHTLYKKDPKSGECIPRHPDFSKCYVQRLSKDGPVGKKHYLKKSSVYTENKCADETTPSSDWAVAELVDPIIPDSKAYPLVNPWTLVGPRDKDFSALLGKRVTTFTASNDDLQGGPTICSGTFNEVPEGGNMSSSCEGGKGASGSPFLWEGEDGKSPPAFMGLLTGGSKSGGNGGVFLGGQLYNILSAW